VTKARRQSLVVRTPDWQLLDKAWRPILLLAVAETELPAADEEDQSSPMRKPTNMRRARTRRGGRGSTGPLDNLPSPAEMLIPSDFSDAYRLAVLLTHKLLNKDEWDASWETTETSLRDSCLEKGAHPVWSDLAQHTPLFGQFAAFPVAKPKKTATKKKIDMAPSYIDPTSSKDLAMALEALAPTVDTAEAQVALRTVSSQLSAGRNLTPGALLFELEGQASALSALLLIATGNDASDALVRLKKADKTLASDLSDLVALRNGEVNDWVASTNAQANTPLQTPVVSSHGSIHPNLLQNSMLKLSVRDLTF